MICAHVIFLHLASRFSRCHDGRTKSQGQQLGRQKPRLKQIHSHQLPPSSHRRVTLRYRRSSHPCSQRILGKTTLGLLNVRRPHPSSMPLKKLSIARKSAHNKTPMRQSTVELQQPPSPLIIFHPSYIIYRKRTTLQRCRSYPHQRWSRKFETSYCAPTKLIEV